MADDNESPVQVSGAINITDILGIGRAINSPAAREITRAFSEPLRILLESRASASAIKTLMVAQANAEVQTARIRDENHELLQRAGQRFVAQEVAKQVNLEATIELAIDQLERSSTGTETARTLDEAWLLRWTEGAQYASTAVVREIWARILGSQAQAKGMNVSGPSLALLAHIDHRLAISLTEFVRMYTDYGCFPWGVTYSMTSDFNAVSVLHEVGFLAERESQFYHFYEFSLSFRGNPRPKLKRLELSNRGQEVVAAIFGNSSLSDRSPPSDDEKFHVLTDLVYRMIEGGGGGKVPMPVVLGLPGRQEETVMLMLSKRGYPGIREEATTAMERKGAIFTPLSERIIHQLLKTFVVYGVWTSAEE